MAAPISETGAQLLARLGCTEDLTNLETAVFPNGLQEKDVVELYGEDGTGKSQMLLHLICNCILPPSRNGIEFGGLGVGLVFIDTDYHFSVLRLAGMLESRILQTFKCKKKTNTSEPGIKAESQNCDVEELIKECLNRMFVVQCSSIFQLIVTLHSFDTLLANKPTSLLIVDSISQFYWIDKSNGAELSSSQDRNLIKVVTALVNLQEMYNIAIIATKAALFQKKSKFQEGASSNQTKGVHDHMEYLCKSWQNIVTKRLIFRRKLQNNDDTNSLKSSNTFTISSSLGQKHDVTFSIVDAAVKFL